MEERSGGVNGRNGPGLGTRGFPLAGCIDFVGAYNKIDDTIDSLTFHLADVGEYVIRNWSPTRQPIRTDFGGREETTEIKKKKN